MLPRIILLCLSLVLAVTHHRHGSRHVPASKPTLPSGTGIPALVFVSRQPVPGGEVPGLGPGTGRTRRAGS